MRAEGTPSGAFTELAFEDESGSTQNLPQSLPSPPVFGAETEIVGGSAVEAKPADELILSADGTGYPSPSDFVAGQNGWTPITFGGQYRFDVPDAQTTTGHDVGSDASGKLVDKQTDAPVQKY